MLSAAHAWVLLGMFSHVYRDSKQLKWSGFYVKLFSHVAAGISVAAVACVEFMTFKVLGGHGHVHKIIYDSQVWCVYVYAYLYFYYSFYLSIYLPFYLSSSLCVYLRESMYLMSALLLVLTPYG